jgi:hypothetical protein
MNTKLVLDAFLLQHLILTSMITTDCLHDVFYLKTLLRSEFLDQEYDLVRHLGFGRHKETPSHPSAIVHHQNPKLGYPKTWNIH